MDKPEGGTVLCGYVVLAVLLTGLLCGLLPVLANAMMGYR